MSPVEAAVAAGLTEPPLLAVSGGRDSVAMMLACRAAGAAVAHVDHGVSPRSGEWAALVERAASEAGLPCEVVRVEGGRSEASMRAARYAALEEVAGRRGLGVVAVAHTADDQAETVLHRALRGTGVRGLAGMAARRPLGAATLVRPLLGVTRAEVTAYLEARGAAWADDPTNATGEFTRGWIRNELLPSVRGRVNPEADAALRRLAESAAEHAALAEEAGRALLDRSRAGEGLDCRVLREGGPLARREALRLWWRERGWPERGMSRERWLGAAAVIEADGPAGVDLPGVRLRRSGGVLSGDGREPPV